jgi:hypothetical protein
MSVPAKNRAPIQFRRGLALLLLGLTTVPLFAKGPEPATRISLQDVGFLPVSPQFLLAGSSMLTLHFVDDKHLLLTYNSRRLLTRLPNDPPEDQDRNVDAVLIEVPSGRVLARTGWRLHDHGQYLWSLGHGRFLLRTRDTLTTFAPLVNLPTGQPFRERPFITSDRRIAAILFTPDADLLIIESLSAPPAIPSDSAANSIRSMFSGNSASSQSPDPQSENDPNAVQINFFRVAVSAENDEVRIRPAGEGHSRVPGRIPATAAGYLAILDQGRDHWAFDFNSYSGKVRELSPFDSSCRPSPLFVSRSEFIAFGCHGGRAAQIIGAFNLRGEEMWEQNIYDSYVAPSAVFAPASGRFALSRLTTRGSIGDMDLPLPEFFGPQSVVVYQIDSGKQLLRVESLPVQRAGQNFSLSPDGMSLAVLHFDEIDIYSLPPLTPKDQTAVKEAQAMAPPETDTPVSLSRSVSVSPSSSAISVPPPPPPSGSQPPDATSNQTNTGDASATPPPNRSNQDQAPPQADHPPVADNSATQPDQQNRRPPSLYSPEAPHPDAPPAESPK